MHRVCLVGAGNIAPVHAQALQELPDTTIAAVCDTNRYNATLLAQHYGVPHIFESVEEAATSGTFDFAHVLVPPPLHEPVSLTLLEAGVSVLVEKPLAMSEGAARKLCDTAKSRHLRLGVNHNQIFYPSYLRLRRMVKSGQLGPVRHVELQFNLGSPFEDNSKPWMFERPANVIYESAPHPFSEVLDLAGTVRKLHVDPANRRDLGGGAFSFATWQIALECEQATAHVLLQFGHSFPSMAITVTCEDGVAHADLVNNRVVSSRRSPWPDFWASLIDGVGTIEAVGAQSTANLLQAVRARVVPGLRTDPYYLSMRRSIAAFHSDRYPSVASRVGGVAGAEVVRTCDLVAASLPAGETKVKREAPRRETGRREQRCDVAVIGGTGFIGRHVVRRLLEQGRSVRVLGRSSARLEPPFDHPLVEVRRADIAAREAVLEGLRGADRVVHLAHGGRMDFEGVESSMVAGTGFVAEACLQSGAQRLVYAGSIASLYLGDPNEVITAATPNDPHAAERGPYAIGKAKSEELLLRHWREDGLGVSIVRPGIVLGEGGTPFHFGFGRFRDEVHCLGWSDGRNPLPLVLVEDVADGVILALDAPGCVGNAYNLVGDVRLSARECVHELARVLAPRPIQFHPRNPAQIQAVRLLRWGVESAVRRAAAPRPSYRELLSYASFAPFDTTTEKAELGWRPVQDRELFVRRAFDVHRPHCASESTSVTNDVVRV